MTNIGVFIQGEPTFGAITVQSMDEGTPLIKEICVGRPPKPAIMRAEEVLVEEAFQNAVRLTVTVPSAPEVITSPLPSRPTVFSSSLSPFPTNRVFTPSHFLPFFQTNQ